MIECLHRKSTIMKEDDFPGGIQEDYSAVQRVLVSRKLLDGFSVIVNRDHILP